MKKFRLLLALQLKNMYAGLFKKKNRKKALPLGMIAIIALACVSLYEYSLIGLLPVEATFVGAQIFVGLAGMLCFISALTTSHLTLLSGKDYERLSHLPVSNFTVVAVKLVAVYLSQMVTTALLLLPMIVIVGIKVTLAPIVFARYFLLMLFFPMLPLFIGMVIGGVIGLLLSRFQKIKSLANFLYLLLLVGFVAFLMTQQDAAGLNSTYGFMAKILPSLSWFFEGAFLGSVSKILWLTGTGLICAGIICLVIGLWYHPLCNAFNAHASTKNKGNLSVKVKGKSRALLKREAKRFFSDTVYFVNNGIAPIMLIGIAVAVAVSQTLKNTLLQITSVPFFSGFLPFLFVSCAAMGPTAASAVSMEGKTLWQIKSLPVPAKSVLGAKRNFQILFTLPFACLSYAVVCFVCKMPVWYALLGGVSLLFTTVAVADVDLFVNLKFPKLEWSSSAQVVKQSAATFISTIGVTLMVAALGAGAGFLCKEIGLWGAGFGAALSVAVCLIFRIIVNTRGVKLWNEL
ncbi:MAG: hypothetical protein IKC56_01140 [Clostridia bacterium]|nr:hypothetical protein [Clostridia bacterium]